MADDLDDIAEQAADGILHLVALMRDVFRLLPIPVELGSGVVRLSQVMIVVERGAALAEYEPMPEEQRDHMRGACIMWLCATSLLQTWDQQKRGFQLLGVFRCLDASKEDLLGLTEYLTAQEASED